MPFTIPAMRARFGSIEYYVTTMRAEELVQKLKIPSELPEWEEMTIEERFQREINYTRVKKHIAPYLVNDPDRFFGSLIVDMYNSDGIEFEPIGNFVKGVPKYYEKASEEFGVLHMEGKEILVPLDGQHRLVALRFALSGKDEKQREIPGVQPNFDVAKDLVTVILVPHDEKKARKIFNKVNRYAKPTTKSENLITADDDIIAVITRKVANDLVGERLVNYQSNTLNKKSPYFTTLSTLYDATHRILETRFGKIDTTSLPDPHTCKLYEEYARRQWGVVLDRFTDFQLALNDKSEVGDNRRRELREQRVSLRPIAQYAIVMAYLRLLEDELPDGDKRTEEACVACLNRLPWSVNEQLWQHVLMVGDKMVAGRTAALFASRFIAYLAGEVLDRVERKALEDNYRGLFPSDLQASVSLPEPIVN